MNLSKIELSSILIEPARPDSADAVALIGELEAYLRSLYPTESQHGYTVEQLIERKVLFFLIRSNGSLVGCGGIQVFGAEYCELKRMYVRPHYQGLGYGKKLVRHMIDYAKSQGIPVVRLETGVRQFAAIHLYEQLGFQAVGPFGDYAKDPNCRFYEKHIDHDTRDIETGPASRTQ